MKWLWYSFLSNILTKRRRAYARNMARMIRLVKRKGNEIIVDSRDWHRLDIRVQGRGNVVKIGRLGEGKGILAVHIFGNNCAVHVGEGFCTCYGTLLTVGIDHRNFGTVEGVQINIGHNVGIESANVTICNSNAKLRIGDDCMISNGISIFHTDAHPVYALGGDAPVNRVGELSIGEHCWIGANATILKNTSIPDDCIVGWGSVVSGKFEEGHCVIAGNPARVVKHGITWRPGDPRYTANA